MPTRRTENLLDFLDSADSTVQNRSDITMDLGCLLSDRVGQVAWESYSPEKWRWLKEVALTQGVAPLLSRTIQGIDVRSFPIPDPVRRELDQAYYRTVASNHLLLRELDRILAALVEASVPVVVLKGAALAASLYGDIGLRPMNDLDLWVEQGSLSKASRVMRLLGYQQLNASYHLVFENRQNMGVELHWQLINLRNPQQRRLNDRLWEQTTLLVGIDPDHFEDHPYASRMLLPSADLIYLAAHLIFHHRDEGRTRLLWLYDLHRLIRTRSDQIDWVGVADLTASSGFGRDFRRILSWVNYLFATEIPESALLQGWEPVCLDDIPLWGNPKTVFTDATGEIWDSIRALDLRNRTPVILGFIFPAPAYITSRYRIGVKWLLPLGYLRRWSDLLRGGVSKWI
jgi:hypothetical protein